MLEKMRGLRHKEKGQSMVELALLMPILCLLLIGIIEFGRIFNAYLIITSASREGARIAAVGSSNTAVVQCVEEVGASLKQDELTCLITPTIRTRGEKVAVKVNYQVDLIAPLISDIVSNPLPLTSTTTMRVE